MPLPCGNPGAAKSPPRGLSPNFPENFRLCAIGQKILEVQRWTKSHLQTKSCYWLTFMHKKHVSVFHFTVAVPAGLNMFARTYIHHLGTSHESHLVKKLVCSTTARMKTFQLQNLVQMIQAKKRKVQPSSESTDQKLTEACPISSKFPCSNLSSPASNGGHAQKRSDFTCGDLHSTPPFDLTKAVTNTHQGCDRIWILYATLKR